MEDKNLSSGLEDTTPETTPGETEEPAGNEAEPVAETIEGENEQAKQDEGGNETEGESEVTPPAPASNESFTVRFNHQDRKLTAEEAKKYAQLGLKYESQKSIYDRLDYGAALAGVSVDKFVDDAVSRPEAEHRKHLEEMYGEGAEEVEIGMDIFRKKRNADYQKFVDGKKAEAEEAEKKAKTDMRARLADEYIELKAEIPDVPEYEKLPDSVIREAASGKRDLLSAYLRYERAEKLKIDAAKKAEAAAGTASAGGKGSKESENDSVLDEFTKGVWSR